MPKYGVAFKNTGAVATGLTPAFTTFLKLSDGLSAGTPPTITEYAGGWYWFDFSPTEQIIFVIDGGAGLPVQDRFIQSTMSPDDFSATEDRLSRLDLLDQSIIVTETNIAAAIGASEVNIRGPGGVDLTQLSGDLDIATDLIRRTLGLNQENYRILSPQFDAGNRLIASIIRIYPTAADVDNNTNWIAEYQLNAAYTPAGQMTDYRVKKV